MAGSYSVHSGLAFSLDAAEVQSVVGPLSDAAAPDETQDVDDLLVDDRCPSTKDFAELQAAALELLDKESQAYKAVLPRLDSLGQKVSEVLDLRRVSDKQELLNRVGTADPETQIVNRIRERMNRVGVIPKTVEVKWEDLTVEARVAVGSSALPTLPNALMGMFKGILRPLGLGMRTESRTILKGASGVLRPGRFTLLLGLPGSGKSTLLKALAGQAQKDKRLRVSGKVTYNGRMANTFVLERICAYIDQVDSHIAELTVRETCNFSAECRMQQTVAAFNAEIERRETAMGITPDPEVAAVMKAISMPGKDNWQTMYIMKSMGLDVCQNTLVGGNMIRGISGGQKRRLTTAEMLASRLRVGLMDEISTGLDSATTLQTVEMLKHSAHNLNSTFLVSLLQPSPEVVSLFDDLMLMAGGRIVYHGPFDEAEAFAQSLGLKRPPGMAVQEFLQNIFSETDQKEFWADGSRPYEHITPETAQRSFSATADGRMLSEAVSSPYRPSEEDERRTEVLEKNKYALPSLQLYSICMRREWKLVKRSRGFMVFRLIQVVVVSLVSGSLFFQMPSETVEDGSATMGIIYFTLLNMMFGGTPEIANTINRLPVLFKQRDYHFFPAWAYVVPNTLLKIPQGLLDVLIWSNVVYWMSGLAPTAGQFFMFMLIMFLVHQVGVTMFRMLATVSRSMEVALSILSVYLLLVQLASGFINSGDAIPPWWMPAYWWSPTAYAIRAACINEFTSTKWSHPNPPTPDVSVGIASLEARGFFTEYYWVWIGAAVLAVQVVAHVLLQILALAYLQPLRGAVTVMKTDGKGNAMGVSNGELSVTLTTPGVSMNGSPAHAPGWRGYHELERASTSVGSSDIETGSAMHAAAAIAAGEAWTPRSQPGTSCSRLSLELTGAMATSNAAVVAAAPAPAAAAGAGPNAAVASAAGSAPTGATATRQSQSAGPGPPPAAAAAAKAPAAAAAVRGPRAKQGLRSSGLLKVQPLTMTFRDVHYFVPLPEKDRVRLDKPKGAELQLLKGITGSFRPGVLTALMGESGAGKTTLMDCLAGRKTMGRLTGDLRVNSFPKHQASFARYMGYCEQTDVHTPQTTVMEAVMFSARLRLPSTTSSRDVKEWVHHIMDLVELSPIGHGLVGQPGVSGLSVEQRKRLTIAVELAGRPSLVFMDEPTSGLDARAAAIVMQVVKNTVSTGLAVVCTVHQPSTEIFLAFDELLLLKRGGEVIFSGPLGRGAQTLVKYFEGVEGVPRFEVADAAGVKHNPSNWALEITTSTAEERLGLNFAQLFRESQLFA